MGLHPRTSTQAGAKAEVNTPLSANDRVSPVRIPFRPEFQCVDSVFPSAGESQRGGERADSNPWSWAEIHGFNLHSNQRTPGPEIHRFHLHSCQRCLGQKGSALGVFLRGQILGDRPLGGCGFSDLFHGMTLVAVWVATHSTGTVSDAIARNFTLFSLEVRQSLREIAMLSRAAGRSGRDFRAY